MADVSTYLDKADASLKEEFKEQNKSKLEVKTNYRKVEFDYSWLEKIENTIEDLDQIVRNPRRFIAQEEEIVPVEKAKKISLESIKHLATHTNLIQEFDEEAGTITPSKVLNINKEESFDIYENRFIYSLLFNLEMFLAKRIELTKEGSNCKVHKKFNYTSKTKIGKENVKFNLEFESDYFEDLVGKDPSGLDLNDRIERVRFIISDFMKSSFIKELSSSHIQLVKSPIRKTNVILKNPNFQKALELWEFIEQYNVTDKIEDEENKDYEDEGILKDEMDDAFLLDYLILNKDHKEAKGMKKYYISKMVKDFINSNDNVDEKSFKKIVNEEFKKIYLEKVKLEHKLENIMNKEFDKFNSKKIKGLSYLK